MTDTGFDIGVCAGHCLQAPGATYGGITEQAFGRKVADRLAVLAVKYGLRIFDPRADLETYAATQAVITSRTLRARVLKYAAIKPRIVLDLHLNAAPQVLHRQDCIMTYEAGHEGSINLAVALVGPVVRACEKQFPGIRAFPVTTQTLGRGSLYLTRKCAHAGIASVICEPFFLSEPGVARWLHDADGEAVELLAQAYVIGLQSYFGTVLV